VQWGYRIIGKKQMVRRAIGFGQDSHKFLLSADSEKRCIIAGLQFEEVPGFDADSDGDIVFHAICNAITSVTHVPILGEIAVDLCHRKGQTDSRIYLGEAVKSLEGRMIEHIAISIEGKRPRLQGRMKEIRQSIASATFLRLDQVGASCTSGDGMTPFGKGEGMMCCCQLIVICR